MLYESFKVSREARRRQHMRQHGKFENLGGQTGHQKVFCLSILKFVPGGFPEASGGSGGLILMFFDVLEVPGPS